MMAMPCVCSAAKLAMHVTKLQENKVTAPAHTMHQPYMYVYVLHAPCGTPADRMSGKPVIGGMSAVSRCW